jgi:hypothetical protein
VTNDVTTSFLTYYLRSLSERTRVEKASTKYGFDWVIYNLALADDLIPYRLPFMRGGLNETSKTKTEPEFGIDCSFLSPDRRTLTIFVLKDEILCNTTWTKNDFDADLRKAAAPNLTPQEFKDVKNVRIVLAYNKDEDQTGIQLYTNLTQSIPGRLANDVTISFERWNLTILVEKVRCKLLTPSLLPQRFFSLFGYICSQFADFRHGSDEWNNQLVPNWRHFLNDLLADNADERSARSIPVALIILREHGKSNPSAETGWIDLTEWAILAAWKVYRATPKESVQQAVLEMWTSFYLVELERFYNSHAAELSLEHSLNTNCTGAFLLDAVASAIVAHWHLARLGILAIGLAEFLRPEANGERQMRSESLSTVANWIVGMLNGNPAAKRPLLDIHHIELFLVWHSLWRVGRKEDIYVWLMELGQRLLVRRAGVAPLPFLEGSNSLDLVFEFIAMKQKPPEFCDQSSLLLVFLLELCLEFDPAKRDCLFELYYCRIALGQTEECEQMNGTKPIDLMGWAPADDWSERVLDQSLVEEGESQTLENIPTSTGIAGIVSHVETFVRQSRTARQFKFPDNLPVSLVILACLKHRSPLPPELWRIPIFGKLKQDNKDTDVGGPDVAK